MKILLNYIIMNKNNLLVLIALPLMFACNGNQNASVETLETSDEEVCVDTSLVDVEEAEPVT
jgi:hypothetical protein